MANSPYLRRALIWLGDTKEVLSGFPKPVKADFGAALWRVQGGETPASAKPLTGIASGVYELRENHNTNTYRVVYVARLARGVYVLDAFVKKSTSGKAIPKHVVERIENRLKDARKRDKG
jgi:phage-related protein